jgi:hypothetical protein
MRTRTLKSLYLGDRLTDHYQIFTETSCQHRTYGKMIYFRFGSKSKMAAGSKCRKTKISSGLTDHHEILTAASYNHQKPEKSIRFRFGRKSKMAAGNEHQNTEIAETRRPFDRSLPFLQKIHASTGHLETHLLPVGGQNPR